MGLLEGKVALITGGSRGIGEAIVREFARQGAKIAFTYVSSRERADAIQKELEAEGVEIEAFRSDASSYVQAETLITTVLDKFGRIDILVNNAGITDDTLMLRMDEGQWDHVVETNLKSVFNLTKHAMKPMLRQRQGVMQGLGGVAIVTNRGEIKGGEFALCECAHRVCLWIIRLHGAAVRQYLS